MSSISPAQPRKHSALSAGSGGVGGFSPGAVGREEITPQAVQHAVAWLGIDVDKVDPSRA